MNKRKIRSLIFTAIALIGIFLIVSAGIYVFKQYQFNNYQSAKYKFSIKYPADWQMQENVEGVAVIFFTPLENNLDFFKENVNIVVQDVKDYRMDLKKYTQVAIRQMRAVFQDNIEIIESAPTRLAGKPAYKFVYIGKGPEAELKMMHIWTIHNQVAYQFTFSAISSQFEKYNSKVETMVRSFKVSVN